MKKQMKKMCSLCLSLLAGLGVNVYATDDRREICSSVPITTTFYYGVAQCKSYGFWGDLFVDPSNAVTDRYVDVPIFNTYGNFLGRCSGALSNSFTGVEYTKQCTTAPYQPQVTGVKYQSLGCSNGLTKGKISWKASNSIKYHLQEKTGGSWFDIAFTESNHILFDRKSQRSLRIRGFKENYPNSKAGFGSWKYFTAKVPSSCGGGGGGTQPF